MRLRLFKNAHGRYFSSVHSRFGMLDSELVDAGLTPNCRSWLSKTIQWSTEERRHGGWRFRPAGRPRR
jgi:hypothetical protein